MHKNRRQTVLSGRVALTRVFTLVFALVFANALAPDPRAGAVRSTTPRQAAIKVIRSIPKEAGGFTQGLEYRNGVLYESVGFYGQSELRTVNLKTGKVTKRSKLDPKFFAEGLTMVPGEGGKSAIVQLTWKEKTAVVWDPKALREIRRYTYNQEGWGLCFSTATKQLIHSDGSSVFLSRDPNTFAERKRIQVRMPDGSMPNELNELECEKDSVFANVWQQNMILEIDQKSGTVLRVIDASSIVPSSLTSPDDVLNGIAALGKNRYLLTGKRWPTYFEVSFVEKSG